MDKVRPWCGQRSDRGRLRNRSDPIRADKNEQEGFDVGPVGKSYRTWTRHHCGILLRENLQ